MTDSPDALLWLFHGSAETPLSPVQLQIMKLLVRRGHAMCPREIARQIKHTRGPIRYTTWNALAHRGVIRVTDQGYMATDRARMFLEARP